MTKTENLKNWLAVYEASDELVSKLETFKKDNQNKNADYTLEVKTNLDNNDNDLLYTVTIAIKHNSNNVEDTFVYAINNTPDIIDEYANEEDDYPSARICTLENKEKDRVLKEYEELYEKVSSLKIDEIIATMEENRKNGLVFCNNEIYLQNKKGFGFSRCNISRAKIILKDDTIYFLDDNNKKHKVWTDDDLNKLQHLNIKEFATNDVIILPDVDHTMDYSTVNTKTSFVHSELNERIVVENDSATLQLTSIDSFAGWIFNPNALGNPNIEDKFVKYYQKDVNDKNKQLIAETNKQKTQSYGTFSKTYLQLNKDAFVDMIKILNWNRAMSLRGEELKRLNIDSFDDLGNRSIKSFTKEQQEIIAKFKQLADTSYDEIDYEAVLNDVKNFFGSLKIDKLPRWDAKNNPLVELKASNNKEIQKNNK